MAFEEDEAFAFEGEGVFVQLVEEEDTVGDLDGELRVFRAAVVAEVVEAAVDDGVGDLRFYVVEPVVFGLQEEGAAFYDIDKGVDVAGVGGDGLLESVVDCGCIKILTMC